jgi:membrane protein implicated in regulation of membrane protease activity
LNDTSVKAGKFPNSLSSWSTRRVIVACALWLVGAPVLATVGLILAGLVAAALSGDQRISFTASLDNWSLAWFFVPPLLLVSAWLWSKRRGTVVAAPESIESRGREVR